MRSAFGSTMQQQIDTTGSGGMYGYSGAIASDPAHQTHSSFMRGAGGREDYEDMLMRDDDELNMSGQFSPPHEPEEPHHRSGFPGTSGKLDGSDANDIDSPYADLGMKQNVGVRGADDMLLGSMVGVPRQHGISSE